MMHGQFTTFRTLTLLSEFFAANCVGLTHRPSDTRLHKAKVNFMCVAPYAYDTPDR